MGGGQVYSGFSIVVAVTGGKNRCDGGRKTQSRRNRKEERLLAKRESTVTKWKGGMKKQWIYM